jgi:hypothetical protein
MDETTFSYLMFQSRRKYDSEFSDFMKRWMSGHLKRYHTLPLHSNQWLSAHQYGVAQIIRFIYPNCSKELLEAALDHDVPEVRVGDNPYPAKRYKNMSQLLNEMDEAYLKMPKLSDEEFKMLKLADMLEFYLYTNFERCIGNSLLVRQIKNGYDILHVMLDSVSEEVRDKCLRLVDMSIAGEFYAPDVHRLVDHV